MRPNETMARALVADLGSAGVPARVEGAGVHWRVEVGPGGSRALLVHCFWYDWAPGGLALGLNPGNARSRLGDAPAPYEGPEYLVVLQQDGARVADGRTRDATKAAACARAWLGGREIDELVGDSPFVDAKPRAMRALAKRLDPGLRWEIEAEHACALWVYGEGRSCRVMATEDRMGCGFFLGQAQVAHGRSPGDVPAAVTAWLVDRLPLRDLAAEVSGIEIERHAELLVEDPARWHWATLLDRVADPDDVLAPLRRVVEELAKRPVATAFYSYSSLNRLCFSASSHYPWVDEGLPMVVPAKGSFFAVVWKPSQQEERPRIECCDLDGTVRLVESALASSTLRPFFGSAPQHELPLLSECLAQQGSTLRPEVVQRGQWYELRAAAGPRSCTLSRLDVTFAGPAERRSASFPTLGDAARAICAYCEGGGSLDEVTAKR
jgi:hypothetical protein